MYENEVKLAAKVDEITDAVHAYVVSIEPLLTEAREEGRKAQQADDEAAAADADAKAAAALDKASALVSELKGKLPAPTAPATPVEPGVDTTPIAPAPAPVPDQPVAVVQQPAPQPVPGAELTADDRKANPPSADPQAAPTDPALTPGESLPTQNVQSAATVQTQADPAPGEGQI